ncbi:viral A-type inclusion protein repeat protein [Nannizzia gypsea CBS 118893]|uniref:Viral A-type inclusion protein repeat protein n=1 Tax=Arthroderma gypseum (strain ATCC MYA-4604 / CBS 118893) TaxID=535722 RepID=E4V5S2_ARTGP|nr:viral A-type inclusion protein repeat protein [Nannizzia gypsea CBS 118893]EFR05447.1 viral A-type inclusion protein repeat protein [Nannizzia gypsea CBS 118893]
MFQRIRGAIDARIAEEQARQRASQEALSRSNSAARKSNNASPSQRTSRVKQDGSGIPCRGPDPAEFDGDTIIGDDESATEAASSNQGPEKAGSESSGQQAKGDAKETSTTGSKDGSVNELPTDIRVRLRRLDKLEARYQELLKAYRAAHARVLTIEPFETALRENTPLTSITDPRALTEYLNQISLKGDMVVEELKRVSSERDEFKAKVENAEKSAKEALDEVSKLKNRKNSTGDSQAEDKEQATPTPPPISPHEGETSDNPKKSPAPSMSSMTTSIPGLSIFSPKTKPVSSPPPVEEAEEFFSFDNEIPRLESEIKARDKEITGLKSQVKSLTDDLAVARESTEGMVHSLESATRKLSGLRESKDHQEAKLASLESSFKEKITSLESKLESVSSNLDKSTAEVDELRSQIKVKEEEINQVKSDLNVQEQSQENNKGAGKRLEILQGVVTNLKSQLKEAEDTVSSLKAELSTKEAETNCLSSVVSFIDKGLDDNETWKSVRERIVQGEHVDFAEIEKSITGTGHLKPAGDTDIPSATNTAPAAANAAPSSSKKKNKKKKKGTKQEPDEPAEVVNANTPLPNSSAISDLELKIQKLEVEIAEKDAAIDRLCLKLKGEENLREEIETLQDEVISLGQDHVEAKDKVKELLAGKSALEHRAAEFEKEIASLRLSSTQSSDAEKAHKDLSVEFEDLKSKALILETDLNAAQQLAATRFKDVSDLRESLQKIQPELRSLRAESAELKTVKEELKTKTSQVSDLEQKHEDLRSEMRSLQSSIQEKDSEVKTLRQKISQESNGRLKAEQALEIGQADLRYSEGKKQEAIEANEKTLRDLSKTEEDLQVSQSKLRDLEGQISQLNRDIEQLRDDIKLKTAQYSSAQGLMSSMRDQASEMAMQVKETTERCEGLEEEVADAHRLLSERSREGETMRRMLSDIEIKADIKVREHKERLEAVIEERDRAEDEANSANRRRAREIEELRTKARDAEKALRRMEEDKDEVEHAQREWKRRRVELESQLERSNQELNEVKDAMSHLRDALDESERHAKDLEKEKTALHRSIEETNQRLEKLKRTNKSLASDLKASQLPNKRGIDSGNRSPRSSLESARQRGVTSPPPGPNSGRNGSISRNDTPTPIDYVYLKNVLLQFLEQKDRNHQKQLIPVLGMLLHFDPTDEQKWMSAITSR